MEMHRSITYPPKLLYAFSYIIESGFANFCLYSGLWIAGYFCYIEIGYCGLEFLSCLVL